MAEIASLKVSFGADDSKFQAGIKKMNASLKNFSANIEQTGKTLSTRLTAPLVAMAAVSVRAFGKQEDAERKLRAALQANGREVDGLFNRYNNFAKEMQRTTVIGDEVTLAMLQQAESLGLTGDAAERAVKNSIAMQSAFGVNAESAIRYTAALEQGNATMLTRYLPTLRDIEDESERVAEAQRLLGNAFGIAEAEAQGVTGQLSQMKNALGDAAEEVGKFVAKAIIPLAKRVKEAAERFQELDDDVKQQIVSWGAFAAAVGPALIILSKVAKAIALIISPIFLKLAAITALGLGIVYLIRNYEALKKEIPSLIAIIDQATKSINFQVDAIKKIGGVIKSATGLFKKAGEEQDELNDKTEEGEEDVLKLESAMEFLKGTLSDVGDFVKSLTADFFNLGDEAEATAKKLKPIFTIPSIEGSSQEIIAETTTIAESYEDMANRAMNAMLSMRNITVDGVNSIGETLTEGAEIVEQFSSALQRTMTDAATSFAESFGQMVASGMKGQSFFNMLLGIMADFASQIGRIIIGIGVAMLNIKQNLFTNPAAVIASGAALVALGSALRAAISAGPGGGGGGGQSFTPSASTVPSASGAVEFRIGYDALYGVLNNGTRNQSRVGRNRTIGV